MSISIHELEAQPTSIAIKNILPSPYLAMASDCHAPPSTVTCRCFSTCCFKNANCAWLELACIYMIWSDEISEDRALGRIWVVGFPIASRHLSNSIVSPDDNSMVCDSILKSTMGSEVDSMCWREWRGLASMMKTSFSVLESAVTNCDRQAAPAIPIPTITYFTFLVLLGKSGSLEWKVVTKKLLLQVQEAASNGMIRRA